MKLNPPRPSPREAGFHREAISSTEGGFLPPTADLVEKSTLAHAFFCDECPIYRTFNAMLVNEFYVKLFSK